VTYSDALTDERLYAAWLTERYEAWMLADRIVGLIVEAGYAMEPALAKQMAEKMAEVDACLLAEFLAIHGEPTDERPWQLHCAATYDADLDGSDSAEARNGGTGRLAVSA
jgi:hypothetical protein